jgi:uncharacterized DUF497 family protein
MDIEFEYARTAFVWHAVKACDNERKHGVEFFEAVTVFNDPMLVPADASTETEARTRAIGFGAGGRLLTVVYLEAGGELIRIISAWRATALEEALYDR